MQGDYAELVFEVKNISKTIRDIVRVRKEIEKTGKETKNLQDTILSGWSFGKVFQSIQKFGDAFKDVQITMRSFGSIYGEFNKRADSGVKMLMKDFQETERSAKKLLNLLGSRTMNLGLDPNEFTKVNVELARITQEISAATGQNLEEVGKKLSQSLAGEVGGLKDLGIIINSSGDKFKDAVQKLKTTGLTEEAAKAMVIFNEIQKQTQKFDGSFKEGAKSITQSFGNIQNTLTSGAFAKAGETLSKILVPILNTIDKILGNDIVAHLTGITLAIGSLTVAVLLLKKAVGGFSDFIGLSGLIGKGGGLLAKLAPGLTKAIMGLLPVITSALAAVGSALVAALPVILAAALAVGLTVALVKTVQLIRQKGFVGAAKAIGEWFVGLGESIVNWFKGKGFKSDKELKQLEEDQKSMAFAKKLDELKAKLNANIKEINGAWASFWDAWNKGSGFNFFVKESTQSAKDIRKKLQEDTTKIQNTLLENQKLVYFLGHMQDGLFKVSKNILSSQEVGDKNKLYDSIVHIYDNFGEELQKIGVTTRKLKKRVGANGETIVDEKEINNLFSSAVFEKDFVKIREFILKKYGEEVAKWAFVKRQANRAGAPNVKVPSKEEIQKQLGINDTFSLFEKTTAEAIKESFDKLSDDDFMKLGGELASFKEKFKGIYENVKKGFDDWTLDVDGMDLSKFRELTKSDKFRVQLASLLKAIGDSTLKKFETSKELNEAFWKDRALFKQMIDKETNALKEWRKDKWDIISNSFNVLGELQVPGVGDLEGKLKNQKDKILKFKNLFNIDTILNGFSIPDKFNAESKLNGLKSALLKDTQKLAKLFQITEDELAKLSKEEIGKRLDKALQAERSRLESEEELYKKSMDPYTEKEKIALLKELQQHYLDKFNIEMEGLEKERQYIEETNNFIKESLSKALEWSPQGISAIQSNTMEGYKFMTSGFKDLGNFSSVINQKNNDEVVLQKQTNDLIKGAKTIIDQIDKKIADLVGNAPTLTFVN
jgi:hypothetical protein